MAMVSDLFFSKESKSEKKYIFFGESEGKGRLASISEFVLQRIKIKIKIIYLSFFVCVWGGRGGVE